MIDTVEVADQAPEQSVSDRIASKFGFPPADQAPEAVETAPESDLAELEWDGAKYQVPAKLKDAFMKNEDYTRKTQELSQQRASLDQVRTLAEQRQIEAAFGNSIEKELQDLHVIDAYLAQAGQVDWTSMSTDQILRHKIELDNIKERRVNIQQTIAEKREKFKAEVDTKITELRAKSREIASKAISGFSDKTEAEVRTFAAKSGLAEAEINNVLLDPRSYQIMWKAMQFENVQASTGKAASAVDKVLRPGAASEKMPSAVAAKLNFNKAMAKATTSGDKARVIEQRLAGAFAKGR
jgi:hypothetical protein